MGTLAQCSAGDFHGENIMKKIILASALVVMALGAAPLAASAATYDNGCNVSSNSPTPDNGFCSNNATAEGLQPRGSNH